MRIGRMSVLRLGWKQDKNQINPLGRMEGDALAVMLPLWSYKSKLLSPNRKHITTFLQKVTILAKAINRDKHSRPLAYCP